MHDEISVESANQCVNGLVAEIHRLQEPKTPTKEQIDFIANKVVLNPRKNGFGYKIRRIIAEWEKIRNNYQ